MDLHFSTFSTPIGMALAVRSATGLRSLRFASHEVTASDLLPVDDGLLAERDDGALAEVASQIEEYFDGSRRDFDLPLDLDEVRGFARAALEAIRTIPYGETAGYGEVAVLAGAPRAARAVGTACARTPISLVLPVHRVVRADGSPGSYGTSPDIKRFLLHHEAILRSA